jgi:glucosamine-6-phosphate deaminase
VLARQQPIIKASQTTFNMNHFTYDKLRVLVFPNRTQMGSAAASAASDALRNTLNVKGEARIVVASAPSQNEVMTGLASAQGIDWGRVTVFHMDEYVGLTDAHAASFRNYQKRHFLSRVSPKVFHGIRGEAIDMQAEISRYRDLFCESQIDLVCMGIGENGHIAFNDPPVADFNDHATIKLVELDSACRQQQINDGCFQDLTAVPTHALSLTCPALMSAKSIVCTVPSQRKAKAVKATLTASISTACPATILRTHPNASLFLDAASASELGNYGFTAEN